MTMVSIATKTSNVAPLDPASSPNISADKSDMYFCDPQARTHLLLPLERGLCAGSSVTLGILSNCKRSRLDHPRKPTKDAD